MSPTSLLRNVSGLVRRAANTPNLAAATTADLSHFSTTGSDNLYKLPELPYDYSALEPYISAEIMEIHHSKHHKTYVTGLNKALEQYKEAEHKKDLQAMIALEPAIRFNGGGHINHSIFWTNLRPNKEYEPPAGAIATALQEEFGGLGKFVGTFNAKAAAVQGSGWGWLGYNKATRLLEIATCSNQDPLSTKGLVPLLGIDVWEHAYYLQYKNVRQDYLNHIWNVVNWDDVNNRYSAARGA